MPNSGVDMVQYLFLSHVLLNWFNVDYVPMGIIDLTNPANLNRKLNFKQFTLTRVIQCYLNKLIPTCRYIPCPSYD
jgi:hypothetical protein